ncbi:hypothetical protein BU26DRAFT_349660 [Trematosphaeria pertusa]|uniref:Uncharacterized protein n=1 Tax=Trematosphaeria pertusa TaxID=390896 RepID=A0A6A6IBW3_9PLEO|nr:uncharacterized protein BU26DRAFT_349660 [Trematosphaeria pertusa]KAF2247558.1 hypothetical protein BU26DRAFT_349660 [Trematosphaeria pertusa]
MSLEISRSLSCPAFERRVSRTAEHGHASCGHSSPLLIKRLAAAPPKHSAKPIATALNTDQASATTLESLPEATNPAIPTNMTSKGDWDFQLSSSKIEPLESPTKHHFPRDRRGSIGEDFDVEHTHIAPLDSPIKGKSTHPISTLSHTLAVADRHDRAPSPRLPEPRLPHPRGPSSCAERDEQEKAVKRAIKGGVKVKGKRG